MKNKKRRKTRKLKIILGLLIVSLFLILKFVPIFVSLNGDKTINIEVNSEFIDPGANSLLNTPIKVIGQLDTSKLGKYKIGYRSFIQTIYRTINVVDTTPPTINLIGKDVFINPNDEYIEEGVQIIDNYDSNLENNLTIKGSVDTSKVGTYTIEYSVKDNSGNLSESIFRNVYVIDDDFNYLNKVEDSFNLDQDILDNINNYLNRYYQSLKYLKTQDVSDLFSNEYLDYAKLLNAALDSLVDYRNLSINDLKLDDCTYSYKVSDVSYLDNLIKVSVLEDSSFNFHFLNGITSKQAQILIDFYLTQENGEYKLSKVLREEGIFLYFDEKYEDNKNIESIKNEYLDILNESVIRYENLRQEVNNGLTYTAKSYTYPYDRNKVKTYAIKYADSRNPEYDFYESNCNNYVSQCMHAGGIPMDDTGTYQWKYYSFEHDEESEAYGFTYSWTYIPSFIEYLDNGDIVNSVDVNLYFGEAGDVVAIDMIDQDVSRSPHVIIVSEQIKDNNGNVLDILICGNTNDQVNLPLSAMPYAYKKLIKIDGYN